MIIPYGAFLKLQKDRELLLDRTPKEQGPAFGKAHDPVRRWRLILEKMKNIGKNPH